MRRERALKIVLVLVGLIFLFGVYSLMMFLWSSGWRWQPNQPEYEQMILGVYATLGIFLLLASRNPSENRSLIAFTAWSSLVHAAIMAVQAFQHPSEHGHLLGDIRKLQHGDQPRSQLDRCIRRDGVGCGCACNRSHDWQPFYCHWLAGRAGLRHRCVPA